MRAGHSASHLPPAQPQAMAPGRDVRTPSKPGDTLVFPAAAKFHHATRTLPAERAQDAYVNESGDTREETF